MELVEKRRRRIGLIFLLMTVYLLVLVIRLALIQLVGAYRLVVLPGIFVNVVLFAMMLTPYRNYPIINRIVKILGIIIGAIFNVLARYAQFLVPVSMFFGMCLLLVFVVLSIIKIELSKGIIYLLLLFTVVFISYKGALLAQFLSKICRNLNLEEYEIIVPKVFISSFDFRRRMYEFMIALNIITNLENLTGSKIIDNYFWADLGQISFQVLVSYIAIDTYITIFNRRSLGRE